MVNDIFICVNSAFRVKHFSFCYYCGVTKLSNVVVLYALQVVIAAFFCKGPKENMKTKRNERERCKLSTLASLQQDYSKPIHSGYSITKAKFHIDVIEEAMFNVTNDQVFFIPSLSY